MTFINQLQRHGSETESRDAQSTWLQSLTPLPQKQHRRKQKQRHRSSSSSLSSSSSPSSQLHPRPAHSFMSMSNLTGNNITFDPASPTSGSGSGKPAHASLLWIPYVLIALLFIVFLGANFWRYHKRHRERYLRKRDEKRVKDGLHERRRITALMRSHFRNAFMSSTQSKDFDDLEEGEEEEGGRGEGSSGSRSSELVTKPNPCNGYDVEDGRRSGSNSRRDSSRSKVSGSVNGVHGGGGGGVSVDSEDSFSSTDWAMEGNRLSWGWGGGAGGLPAFVHELPQPRSHHYHYTYPDEQNHHHHHHDDHFRLYNHHHDHHPDYRNHHHPFDHNQRALPFRSSSPDSAFPLGVFSKVVVSDGGSSSGQITDKSYLGSAIQRPDFGSEDFSSVANTGPNIERRDLGSAIQRPDIESGDFSSGSITKTQNADSMNRRTAKMKRQDEFSKGNVESMNSRSAKMKRQAYFSGGSREATVHRQDLSLTQRSGSAPKASSAKLSGLKLSSRSKHVLELQRPDLPLQTDRSTLKLVLKSPGVASLASPEDLSPEEEDDAQYPIAKVYSSCVPSPLSTEQQTSSSVTTETLPRDISIKTSQRHSSTTSTFPTTSSIAELPLKHSSNFTATPTSSSVSNKPTTPNLPVKSSNANVTPTSSLTVTPESMLPVTLDSSDVSVTPRFSTNTSSVVLQSSSPSVVTFATTSHSITASSPRSRLPPPAYSSILAFPKTANSNTPSTVASTTGVLVTSPSPSYMIVTSPSNITVTSPSHMIVTSPSPSYMIVTSPSNITVTSPSYMMTSPSNVTTSNLNGSCRTGGGCVGDYKTSGCSSHGLNRVILPRSFSCGARLEARSPSH